MSRELRRRDNGRKLVVVPCSRTVDCVRNANGNRKAEATFEPPFKTRAVKLGTDWYLLTQPVYAEALDNKRTTLTEYTGRFPRVAALWINLKEKFKR
ncbi:hypothetical protein CJ97_gp22 [Ralstonia phage RSB2]|uniref:Uncharacterized protein ORF22 n=1 Tax=Ralstonia phage RSB2 TaxID=913183 RepID=E5RV02_9CAUD|nr:hypothetical protein CJ97_gp22 [Ralstonia phage RSB2]BAJ51810.1 hypothetical protein [Ralstonia phage RSB2]